jgi:hypothetical protein
MDCVERQHQIVLTDQLIAKLLDPEPPLPAKRQDKCFLIGKDLLGCMAMWTPALIHKARLPLSL